MPITKEQAQKELLRRQAQAELTRRQNFDSVLDSPISDPDYRSMASALNDPKGNEAKIKNTLIYSQMSGTDPNEVYPMTDSLNKSFHGTPDNVSALQKNIQVRKEGKTFRKTIDDALMGAGVGMIRTFEGAALALAEADEKFWDMIKVKRPEYLEVEGAKQVEKSNMYLNAIKQYYKENPDKLPETSPDVGILQQAKWYAQNPKVILQHAIESAPIMMLGGLGKIGQVGKIGMITLFGTPAGVESYVDARESGTSVLPALVQSGLTTAGEGAIENWTFGKKLGLFKNAKSIINKGFGKVAWETAKAYGRGSLEEGTQTLNQNIWRWVFTDRTQEITKGVGESALIGGPVEMLMAGTFGFSGYATGKMVDVAKQKEIVNKIEEDVQKSENFTPEHKTEIQTELEAVKKDINANVYVEPEETKEQAPTPPVEARTPVEGMESTPAKPAEKQAEDTVQKNKLLAQAHILQTDKGFSDTEYKEIKRKTTVSGKAVAGNRMKLNELDKFVKLLQKARPNLINHTPVVTLKTEKQIESLKSNLTVKQQMSDTAFQEILNTVVKGKQAKYIDKDNFIKQSEGLDVIHRMLSKAEELRVTEPQRIALNDNENIKARYDSIDRRIKGQKKHRDPNYLESMRSVFATMQKKTGIPFYTLYQDLINNKHLADRKTHLFWEQMTDVVPDVVNIYADETARKRIEAYVASLGSWETKPEIPEGLTSDEKKIGDYVISKLEDWKTPARFGKFITWLDMGMPEDDRILPQYHEYKKEINKAVDIYYSEGKDALLEYLRGQKWGVISKGYSPTDALTNPKVKMYEMSPGTIGKGRIKVRNAVEFHDQERTLFQRLNSYFRQMALITELQPKIKNFIALTEENAGKFDDNEKVVRYVEKFLQVLKNYDFEAADEGNRWLARIYAQAARAKIILSPMIIAQNIVETLVLDPDKAYIMKNNKTLSEAYREYFVTHVNQSESMMSEHFLVMEKPLLDVKPMRYLNALADKIKLMPWADTFSRTWSYNARVARVQKALELSDIGQIMDYSRFSDLDLIEQQQALAILAKDGKDAFAMYIARVHTDNVHGLYERVERSPFEQAHKIASNLMLFSRNYSERLAKAGAKVIDKTAPMAERIEGAAFIANIMVSGMLMGEVWKMVFKSKRNPWNPFNIWSYELGGLAKGAIEAIETVFSETLRTIQGEDRLDALLTSIVKVPDMFVPFYTLGIRIIESLTDTVGFNKLWIRKIREVVDSDYKVRPSAYEMDRDFVEGVSHIVTGADVDQAIKEREQNKPKVKMKK